MPLSKFAQPTATRKFTDREDAQRAFMRAVSAYLSEVKQLHVLMYYGIGGIGKTSLLGYLVREILPGEEKGRRVRIAQLDLESPQFGASTDCLLSIHKQIDVSCPLFEYAMAKLWEFEGRTLEDIRHQIVKRDSLLFELLDAAASATGAFLPARLVKRLFNAGGDALRRRFGHLREKFSDIDCFSENELSDRLPYYLGIELASWMTERQEHLVVVIDSHETILNRSRFRTTKHPRGDAWLQEFIGAAGKGLYVIAGREYLKWADVDVDWTPYIEQHAIGALTNADAAYFLHAIPIGEDEIVNAIVQSARGVPLYLDLCAAIYLARTAKGETLHAGDFANAETQLVERFLAHMDRDHREALRACAVAGWFDAEVFGALVRALNIGLPVTLLEEFCRTAYVEEVPPRTDVFKIHGLVRDHVRSNTDKMFAMCIFQIILTHGAETFKVSRAERSAWLFDQIERLIADFDLSISSLDSERLVALGLKLIDSGYGRTSEAAAERLLSKRTAPDWDVLRVGAEFLRALCLRKRAALSEANLAYNRLLPNISLLETYAPLTRFHSAHVTHLLGRYDEALGEYRSIAEGADVSASTSEVQFLARRQIADVLMVKGRFRDALEGFDKLEGISRNDPLAAAELDRFRGHIHRFNFRLGDAERLYRHALSLAASINAGNMRGKALTNLAETLCWTKPIEAIQHAEDAIRLNEDVNAPIEVGKALTAKAIAQAAVPGQAINGLATAMEAEKRQTTDGYKGGILLALQAQAIACLALGKRSECNEVLGRLRVLSGEVTTYGFLLLPLYVALDSEGVLGQEKEYQWLAFEDTVQEIKTVLRGFTRER